jgi:hypothetical protein
VDRHRIHERAVKVEDQAELLHESVRVCRSDRVASNRSPAGRIAWAAVEWPRSKA